MKTPPDLTQIPGDLFASAGLPRFPWLWYQGRLVVLEPRPDARNTPHHFGGPVPLPFSGLPKTARVHGLLDLDPAALGLELPPALTRSPRLPLVFPFRHSGAELVYDITERGTLERVEGPDNPRPDRGWPTPGYPAVLPQCPLVAHPPVPVPYSTLSRRGRPVFSVQPFPDLADRLLLVVVTADEETLGFPILGEDAEAAGLQIVFLVRPDLGRVWAFNQCT